MQKSREMESSTVLSKQAVEVLKALSHFEYPTEVSEIPIWLKKVQPLQSFIRTLCENDKSGRTAVRCVCVLYDLIASNGDSVSPAVWNILELVDEDKVMSLAKMFAEDSFLRLENALCALVQATCQCGHRIPQLQVWCYALIDCLESDQKYWVLLSVSQIMMPTLFCSLMVPHTRKLTYPLIERILYQMTFPNAFHAILDQIPEVMAILSKDENDPETTRIYEKLCGLLVILIERFPATPGKGDVYLKIQKSLNEGPETEFHPPSNYPVWDPKGKPRLEISNILECPVCYERFITPILVCENGHCLCSNCRDQLKNCPICRAHFSTIRMTIVEQIMEATEFPCKNFNSGCDVKLLYKDIWNHEIDCEYRTISCDIVTFHNASCLVCNDDVVLCNFHKHIEKCHESFVANFELNVHRMGELRKQKINEVRLLKNSTDDLHFVERIFMTDEEIFFSYHYVGRNADASNYVYTVKIRGKGGVQRIEYSNLCLSNYKGIYDTEMDERCLILEPERIFNPEQTKVYYFVKIEDVSSYRSR